MKKIMFSKSKTQLFLFTSLFYPRKPLDVRWERIYRVFINSQLPLRQVEEFFSHKNAKIQSIDIEVSSTSCRIIAVFWYQNYFLDDLWAVIPPIQKRCSSQKWFPLWLLWHICIYIIHMTYVSMLLEYVKIRIPEFFLHI